LQFDISVRAEVCLPFELWRKKEMPDLSTTFCGVQFANPFVLAPAPPTDEVEMLRRGFEAGWAGAVLKTTSVASTLVPLKYPMITGIRSGRRKIAALGNIDLISKYHVDEVAKRVARIKQEFPDNVVAASIMGARKEDWQSLVAVLEEAGADIIECSFSCPQGTLGSKPGAMLGQDRALVETVTGWVKSAARRVPVVIKLTPQVSDIVEMALAAKRGGADGICASNTIPALMGIDLETLIPIPNVGGKSTYSGLSGGAIKPITLRVIAEIVRHTGMQVTGTGGAATWRDAVEFLLVGARNVQLCTAVMNEGFRIIEDLKDGLKEFMEQKGFEGVEDLIGSSLQFITTHDGLPEQFEAVAKINLKKCIRCDLCYVACRDGGHVAIERRRNREPVVDEDLCVGCGLCQSICPVADCIEIVAVKNSKKREPKKLAQKKLHGQRSMKP
jgi:dihydropyrimidine dehydrogenase (NAD+) subunit PreA